MDAMGSGIVAVFLAAEFARAADQNAASPDAELRFEVASTRASDIDLQDVRDGRRIGLQTLPNGMNATLVTVRRLILSAYQIEDYQLVGGPSWMDSDRFDISGSPNAGDSAVLRRLEQVGEAVES